MFSIDQNSHSLWDALPKLQALARQGPPHCGATHTGAHSLTHFIEDIDVAFTTLGAEVEGDGLRLARERFHRSGGADWGAALFYTEFLGRLAVEIRDWEPYLGMKIHALAHQLDRDIDELYDEFSPSDNWQLIGPSYVGDREHHRTIGDLALDETAPFVRQMMDLAQKNMLGAFPQEASRRRTTRWFEQERGKLDAMLPAAGGKLVDLYRKWLAGYLPADAATLDESSKLLSIDSGRTALLELFTRDYERMAGLYNQALADAPVGLRPLKTEQGELPFFAVYEYRGRCVRSPAHIHDGKLLVADMEFPLGSGGVLPLGKMSAAGICCLAGKAIVMVLQVRYAPQGGPLALPYRGSMYMPAAYRFQQLLDQDGLLDQGVAPVVRVRLRLLDRLRELDTPICLPPHLRACFGRTEIAARELGENYEDIIQQARRRLESFKDPASRQRWQDEAFADIVREIEQLDHRRRELSTVDPKGAAIRQAGKDIKLRKIAMLDGLLRRIDCDWQCRDLDYWDSRGAILPWCIALGGQEFYDRVIGEAEIYEETMT